MSSVLIVTLTIVIVVVLPLLLTITAVGSQFSAAVADTSGAGGLLADLSKDRLREKWAYLVILGVTVLLTWIADVNEIISYASRAFAAYYFLQCLVAGVLARQQGSKRLFLFALLALICLAVSVLGLPSE